ncbi:MAG: hypothetical protein AAGK32_07450 [Actinomycetota bacterium]
MKKTLTATVIGGLGLLGAAAPALAAPAVTGAGWSDDCVTVTVESSKDISNIVYRLDGVDTKIEFEDGTNTYQIPGAATDVWVKSGNNHSGDGPGYGERFQHPERCATDSDAVASTLTDSDADADADADAGAGDDLVPAPVDDPAQYQF